MVVVVVELLNATDANFTYDDDGDDGYILCVRFFALKNKNYNKNNSSTDNCDDLLKFCD